MVTLDGPSGTGKTTLANDLAKRLGGVALHTGLHYRSVTLLVARSGVPAKDESAVASLVDRCDVLLDELGLLRANGEVFATSLLETEDLDRTVSAIANNDGVRARLISAQQTWVRSMVSAGRSVVVEGRDAGTRIAPDADVRFYLRARAEVRAERRAAQRSSGVNLQATLDEIRRRDASDQGHGRTTENTPGVLVVESDGLSPSQVSDRLWSLVVEAARSIRR